MNYREYFIKNNLTSIESFFYYTNCQFNYGWMDQDNHYHQGVNEAKSYSLQNPFELLESKIGICWDMTELYRCWFENMTTLRIETYYVFYDDNKGCPSHSILVYYFDNRVFWFEPMFNSKDFYYSGVYSYQTINELLIDVKDIFIKKCIFRKEIEENYCKNKVYVYKYKRPKYHINGYKMRDHINHGTLINLNY